MPGPIELKTVLINRSDQDLSIGTTFSIVGDQKPLFLTDFIVILLIWNAKLFYVH